MSRMMVHDRVMIELRKQGVTEAMLLECNDDQVALIVEMVDDKSFTGDYIKGVVSGYIWYNKHPITDDDIPDYVPKVMAKIHAMEEVKNMTRSRRTGEVVGSVVGAASEKVVRGGIATKVWWQSSGKGATITAARTTGRGIMATVRSMKDIAMGAAEGAKDSYKSGKATRK